MTSVRPFSEILVPVAEEALAGTTVAEPIRSAFASYLERRLTPILSQVLYLRFCAHRISAQAFYGSSAGCYASFVRSVREKGLASFLGDYPLAMRAIDLATEQARQFMEEFVTHLKEDRQAIATLSGNSSGSVSELRVGGSDPHHGGRTVVHVTLTDGPQLYYKPRSLAVDAVCGAGLATLNARLPLALRVPTVLDCGEHGWAEAIPERCAMSRREAEAFYWRGGAWLAVAWLLDAADFHRSNVVTCGEHPVPVDLETVLHPLEPGEERTLARTGLLPAHDDEWDLSYLGVATAQAGPRTLQWHGVGSDELRASWGPAHIPEASHFPLVEGERLLPRHGARVIVGGWDAVARAAGADRAQVGAWRAELGAKPRRQVYRATAEYIGLLQELTLPCFLKSRDARDAEVSRCQAGDPRDEIAEAERAQLAAWDIPRFQAPSVAPDDLPWEEMGRFREELERCLAFPSEQASAI